MVNDQQYDLCDTCGHTLLYCSCKSGGTLKTNPKAPPWQGECPHTCAHTTVESRRLGCRLRCCRCDVVVR